MPRTQLSCPFCGQVGPHHVRQTQEGVLATCQLCGNSYLRGESKVESLRRREELNEVSRRQQTLD